jgi:serine protease Do
MRKNTLLVSMTAVLLLALVACSGLPATSAIVPATAPASPTTTTPGLLVAPSLDTLQQAYEQVYQNVVPSVVSLEVTLPASASSNAAPDLTNPFNSPNPNLPTGRSEVFLGSGFVWDGNGDIVTNNHVVEGSDSIKVTFADGTVKSAKIVGTDIDSDLAVIKVDPANINLVPVQVADSTQVKVGQIAIAIGNQLGFLQSSMTVGVVSYLGRSLPVGDTLQNGATYTIPDVIQTDAPINHGNSGGVLVDINGRLIGVTTAIESSSDTSGNIGIGYVVPSVIVQKVVPALIAKGVYQHPMIGFTGTTLTSEIATAMNLNSNQRGALVISVSAGGPAEKGGLLGGDRQTTISGTQVTIGGDIIVKIDNTPVKVFEDLTTYLARYTDVGQTIKLTVLRQGKEQELSVTLSARPAQTSPAQAQPRNPVISKGWLGIQGMNLSADIISAMNLPASTKGVLIEQITKGSPADVAGLQGSAKTMTINGQQVMIGGDVITKVDALPVTGVNQLATIIGSYDPGTTITLGIIRDGKTISVDVKLTERPTQ